MRISDPPDSHGNTPSTQIRSRIEAIAATIPTAGSIQSESRTHWRTR